MGTLFTQDVHPVCTQDVCRHPRVNHYTTLTGESRCGMQRDWPMRDPITGVMHPGSSCPCPGLTLASTVDEGGAG